MKHYVLHLPFHKAFEVQLTPPGGDPNPGIHFWHNSKPSDHWGYSLEFESGRWYLGLSFYDQRHYDDL